MMNRIDSQRMYKVYDRWHELASEAYNSNLETLDIKDIDHIVFVGMGGSGILGDFFASILSREPVHIDVVKGYHLPKSIGENSLLVAISVSGNTLETLTVLKKSQKTPCRKLCFSSGGRLEKYCKRNKLPHRLVEFNNSPRASFPSYAYSICNVLREILPVRAKDVKESLIVLEKLQKRICSKNLNESKNPSLELAKWLGNVTAIYYPYGLEPAAIRFKNCLQENAKVHALAEDVLEACHNGIVTWDYPSYVKPVLIQGKDDYTKTKRLWKVLGSYFDTKGIEFKEIKSVDGSILTKLVTLIYLLDYSTIYKAVLLKRDPSPINAIEYIKARQR